MRNRMLVVYNTCGIKGNENTDFYIESIKRILDSNLYGLKVVFSSCLNDKKTRDRVYDAFGSKILHNYIDEVVPVNVSFNHSILETVKRYGQFDCYVFWDSGCLLYEPGDLCYLYAMYKAYEDEAGMMTPLSSMDAHYAYGLRLGRPGEDMYALTRMFPSFSTRVYRVPVGRACGAHVNLISNKLYQYYGRVCPDIFGGFCTESTFSFLCGALNLNWMITNAAQVHHQHAMDGTSSGFNPINNGRPFDYGFRVNDVLARFESEEARRLGMGYEECADIVIHDPSQWNENYHCKNHDLKDWIKNNIFLKRSEFDYSTVKNTFIPYYAR